MPRRIAKLLLVDTASESTEDNFNSINFQEHHRVEEPVDVIVVEGEREINKNPPKQSEYLGLDSKEGYKSPPLRIARRPRRMVFSPPHEGSTALEKIGWSSFSHCSFGVCCWAAGC